VPGASPEYGRPVSRFGAIARTYGIAFLVVVAAIESALEVALRHDQAVAPRSPAWFAVPAAAAVVLPLLAHRRFPLAPAGLWVLGAALSFVDGRLVVFPAGVLVGGIAAAVLVGNIDDRLRAQLGLAVMLGAALVIVSNDPHETTSEFVFIPVLVLIGWSAGFMLRERADQAAAAERRAARAEHERETAARIGVAEERARIARELHDIVAHSVSVMVLQVGAVRHKLPATLTRETDALRDVEQTGRTALAEMRHLLGAMRDERDALETAPQPGLGSLDSLLARIGSAGLAAELHVSGDPVSLPPAIDASAYRIVQEGLTNALKHAGANRADVTVRYGAGEVEIEVRDDGRGAAKDDGLGHGLVGIGERVKLYGGDMAAGTANGGGFVLRARLPLGGYGT
jgi:signal transduction histidine kinase